MERSLVLDGWRGIAIAFVLVGHFYPIRGINLGRFGVELFFVLSGRLMAEILFINRYQLLIFFYKRLTRIYPAMAAYCAMAYIFEATAESNFALEQYYYALTLTANYAQICHGRSEILGHLWSLCIEEHIYLLLGGIAFASRRLRFPVSGLLFSLAALACLAGLIRTLHGEDYYSVYWRSDVRGASILMGAALHLTFTRLHFQTHSLSWLPICAAGAAILLNLNPVPDPIKYSLGTFFLAIAAATVQNIPNMLIKLLENQYILSLSALSFSIYLWQQPFAKLTEGMLLRPIALCAVIIIASLSYHLIEKPARRILNGLIKPNSSLLPAA